MSKVKIECLTDVHIGSGELLYKDNDYCVGIDSDGCDVLGIIDPRKVLNLIGIDNIGVWLAGIDIKRPIMDIVHQFSPTATIEDCCSRIIDNSERSTADSVKTLLIDGLGQPYIPGSSIKGAIRTAVLASEATGKDMQHHIDFEYRQGVQRVRNANRVERHFFGNDPYSDIFRFLQVGDAIFGNNLTSAVTMINLNERKTQSFRDISKKQLIEVISAGDEASFKLRVKKKSYDLCRSDVNSNIGSMPASMTDISSLFRSINFHTKKLMESEIVYWDQRKDKDSDGITDSYIEACEHIMNEINGVDDKSCILRIGHASGWRFITGAWSENTPYFDAVKSAARPNNQNYRDYDFPKSRRISKNCELLGFVRLSLMSDHE